MRDEKNIPIKVKNLKNWKAIRIDECGEKLVSLIGLHKRIYVDPQYYIKSINGAINDCFVRETVADKLIVIAQKLPRNLKLAIWDGWRPVGVQLELFNQYKSVLKKEFANLDNDELAAKTTVFVSVPSTNPLFPSPHLTGGAVDLSIVNNDLSYLPMGTFFDDFSAKSRTNYFEDLLIQNKLNKDEIIFMQNRRLLYFIMTSAGFTNYPNEWWHFDYGNQFWASCLNLKFAIYGKTLP